MTVVEELMAQRDAILFGEHVRKAPWQPGEACAVAHVSEMRGIQRLERISERVLNDVFLLRWGHTAMNVNDHMPHVSTADILDAFDEAIRNAKEQEDATA